MDSRSQYILQIIEKIGGPLIIALSRGRRGASESQTLNPDLEAREDAQAIAQLLARCVQMSIEIGRVMELDMTAPDQADRQRLALMVTAGPLIAGQFRSDGRVPGDTEQKKMMTGLEAVLAFSQNFSATQDNANALAESGPLQATSAMVQSLRPFTSVVNAVGTFPFGQPEKKLIQEIAAKITARAEDMAKNLVPDASAADKMVITATLAEIYANCHAEEMRRMLAKPQDDGSAQEGLENVWARFNIRAGMLEALAESMAPAKTGSAAQSGGETPAPPPLAAPAAPAESAPPASPSTPAIFQSPQAAAAPPAAPPTAPPAEPPAAPPAAPPGGFNPMSMFAAKKPDGEDASAPAEPAAPPSPPPPAEPPPTTQAPPAAPPPETPPQAPPQAPETPPAPPAEDGKDGDNGGSGDQGGSPPGNPMSFFKK